MKNGTLDDGNMQYEGQMSNNNFVHIEGTSQFQDSGSSSLCPNFQSKLVIQI